MNFKFILHEKRLYFNIFRHKKTRTKAGFTSGEKRGELLELDSYTSAINGAVAGSITSTHLSPKTSVDC